MKELQSYLANIKKKIIKKSQENKVLRDSLTQAVKKVFPHSTEPMGYIEDFYMKSTTLIVKTKNKSFANEFFFKKEQLLHELKNNTIRDVVVF